MTYPLILLYVTNVLDYIQGKHNLNIKFRITSQLLSIIHFKAMEEMNN